VHPYEDNTTKKGVAIIATPLYLIGVLVLEDDSHTAQNANTGLSVGRQVVDGLI
jgi:hypothetical protein